MNFIKLYLAAALTLMTHFAFSQQANPWFGIKNNSDFTMTCTMQMAYYIEEQQENKTVYVNLEKDPSVVINFRPEQGETGKDFVAINMTFDIAARTTKSFESIFREDDTTFNPKIISIFMINNELQIKHAYDLTHDYETSFIIDYADNVGFTLTAQSKSFYIDCMSSIKQTIRKILLAALRATESMPY